MTEKLDQSKPYGKAFVGPDTYFGQDGRYFNMETLEEVVLEQAATPTPQEAKAPQEPATVSCKECGKSYKLGPTEKTKAVAVQRMKAHLEKEHGINLENTGQ